MTKLACVTERDFDQRVLFAKQAVLLSFQADWCEPCKLIEPLVEELAREFQNKLTTYTIDVDHDPGLAERCDITSIPCLVLIRSGHIILQRVGATSLSVLEHLIQEALMNE